MADLSERLSAAWRAFSEDETPVLSRDELGTIAVGLALTFPLWVRRRKTTYRYIDDTTVEQRVSIDFRLPRESALPLGGRVRPGTTIYVPIDIAVKRPLVRFSVTDEQANALSLLNTTENGGLVTAGLSALISGLAGAGNRGTAAPEELGREIGRIVTARESAGQDIVEAALNSDQPLGRVLRPSDQYRSLVRSLGSGFLMLVPITYEPGRDRVLKFENRTVQAWPAGRTWTRRVASVLAAVGLTDRTHAFDDLRIGWAQGTHFEFEAPPEVHLAEARLDTHQFDPVRGRRHEFPRRRVAWHTPQVDLHTSPRVVYDPHESDDIATQDMLRCYRDRASVRLRLGPPFGGAVLAMFVTSLIVAALLWVVEDRLVELDGQTSAAVLLLLPALLAAYLVRPGEHAFATRLLRGVRLASLVVGLCAIVGATVIGAGVIKGAPKAPPNLVTTCTPRSSLVGPARRPAVRLDSLRCASPPAHTPAAPARASTRRWVTRVAWLASVCTLVMLLGLVRLLVRDRRHRAQATIESDDPLPSAAPL